MQIIRGKGNLFATLTICLLRKGGKVISVVNDLEDTFHRQTVHMPNSLSILPQGFVTAKVVENASFLPSVCTIAEIDLKLVVKPPKGNEMSPVAQDEHRAVIFHL